MKKITLLVAALLISTGVHADALEKVVAVADKLADKSVSVNAGVGYIDKGQVNATANAIGSGTAGAGGVVAHQKTSGGLVSVNAGVGILKDATVNAKASANGQGSQAHAGGVVATQN